MPAPQYTHLPTIGPTFQRGMASIFFIVLVSLALTTAGIRVMQTFKGAQEINVASNALTDAKSDLWLGAESLRRQLASHATAAEVLAINGVDLDVTFATPTSAAAMPSQGVVAVRNVTAVADPVTGLPRVTADISNSQGTSSTSSAVRVEYEWQPPSAPAPNNNPITMGFSGDLDISGGITIVENGRAASFSVDGNVDVGGISLDSIKEINATGNVTLGSQANANSIYANGDVSITGAALVETAQLLGDFSISGGGYATHVFANGAIRYNASGNSETLHSRGTIDIQGGSHGNSFAGGDINVGAGKHDTIRAVGSIDFTGYSDRVNSAISMADIKCKGARWLNTDLVSANGALDNCYEYSAVFESGASHNFEPPVEIEPYQHQRFELNVWDHKDEANYFIEYDNAENRIKVTVNHINNVVDGTEFYLGDYGTINGQPYKEYLCTVVDGSGKCVAPLLPQFPLCLGDSVWNDGCLEARISNGEVFFTLNSAFTAPGVLLFDGNVLLNNTNAVATILASGDISTAGGNKLWAPNYGSYEKICNADGSHLNGAVRARYEAEFSVYYPSNFCPPSTSAYKHSQAYKLSQLGNVAMAAGGFPPSTPDYYKGGAITLDANSAVVGAVLAGDVLTTKGDVTINGLVSSGGQGDSKQGNSLSSRTVIDFTSDRGDFDPTNVPGTTQSPLPAVSPVTVVWMRNL